MVEAASPSNWHLKNGKLLFLCPQFLLTAVQFAASKPAAIISSNKVYTYLSGRRKKILPQLVVGYVLAMQYVFGGDIKYEPKAPHYLLEPLRMGQLSKILARNGANPTEAINILKTYLKMSTHSL